MLKHFLVIVLVVFCCSLAFAKVDVNLSEKIHYLNSEIMDLNLMIYTVVINHKDSFPIDGEVLKIQYYYEFSSAIGMNLKSVFEDKNSHIIPSKFRQTLDNVKNFSDSQKTDLIDALNRLELKIQEKEQLRLKYSDYYLYISW